MGLAHVAPGGTFGLVGDGSGRTALGARSQPTGLNRARLRPEELVGHNFLPKAHGVGGAADGA